MSMQLLQQSLKAHQVGDFRTARAGYQSLLSLEPNNPKALGMLGMLELQEGHFQKALELLDRALVITPNDGSLYLRKGAVLQQMQRWSEVEDNCKKAMVVQPDNPEFYYMLGIAHIAQGERNLAGGVWKKALALAPGHVEVLINLGMWHHEGGDLRGAHKCWERAYGIQEDNPRLLPLLAAALRELACIEPKSAVRHLHRSTQMDSKHAQGWGMYADALLLSGKGKKAFEACKKALALAPEKGELHHSMGNIFRATGQLEQALEAYERSARLGSTHPATLRAIAVLKGEKLEAGSEQVVRQLFDQYAERFDEHLLDELGYKTPTKLYDLLMEHRPNENWVNMLDLGCGTGLSALPFVHCTTNRIGVDLSGGMVEQARSKNEGDYSDKPLYRDLFVSELRQFLNEHEEQYQLALCSDTLNYLGDCSDVFELVSNRLTPKGLFLCSTEHWEGEGFHMQINERFAHSEAYIKSVCAPLKLIASKRAVMRYEADVAVWGTLWLFER
ncbi:MAG: hypothetical protein CMK59_05360 [Proteobacteria bacterium]|nr:hypothetical protein [Pseudomonadota bacterium]